MKERLTDSYLFEKLFNQYRESFILFANSYIRDMIAAEDIYVEAMMNYWEKRSNLPPETNIPAYILMSVKNKALNYLRHLNIKAEAEEHFINHSLRELNFRISSLESCDPSELFSNEISEIIEDALKKLPEQTCIIFKKSRFDSKSNREIAVEESLTIKAVEYHITKALKVLRNELKDYMCLLNFLF